MELSEFEGEHTLDAVDFSNEQVKTWGDHFEDCEVVRFRLDGQVFVATEDPDDGYRSCMRDLVLLDASTPMQNVFTPTRVLAKHRDKRGEYGDTADVLELVDAVTGKIVLAIGTDNTYDYYPWFVSEFDPSAMACNAAVQS